MLLYGCEITISSSYLRLLLKFRHRVDVFYINSVIVLTNFITFAKKKSMIHIERSIFQQILEAITPNKAVLLFGARRVGKTVLLKEIAEKASLKTIFLNGEDYDTQLMLERRSISNYLELFSETELLIIDEAQQLPDIGKMIKLIVDEIPGIRVIASGSSSFDLLNKTGEPLVGRSKTFKLYPLGQSELSKYENKIATRQNLANRLVYGTYPELTFIEKNSEKEDYLRDITNAYLYKDILSIEGIRNDVKMKSLVRLIAFQVGNEVSYEELGRQTGMSKNTVEKYLDLLSKCFVIYRLGAFSKNLRSEVTKAGKWYFYDNGIRNSIISDFTPLNMRKDIGVIWENYLISERIKKNSYSKINIENYFWRTYDKQEIDYLEIHHDKICAFEIKWTKDKCKIPSAFEKTYPEANFTLINKENYLDFIT